MAARWLQQKKAKIKRMRRAWAKPYSMKGTGPATSPGYIAEDNQFKPISVGSRSKVAKSAPNFDTMSKFLLRTFKPTSPEAIYARLSGLHTDLAPGNKMPDQTVILAKMIQSSNGAGTLQGEIKYVHAVVDKYPNYEIRLYISGPSCFFFEEIITEKERVYKRSVEYEKTEHAIDAWKGHHIIWEARHAIPL